VTDDLKGSVCSWKSIRAEEQLGPLPGPAAPVTLPKTQQPQRETGRLDARRASFTERFADEDALCG
jgi:hypothetical protein